MMFWRGGARSQQHSPSLRELSANAPDSAIPNRITRPQRTSPRSAACTHQAPYTSDRPACPSRP